ncbi:hypothetical protein [Emticicia fluvialis]|uniref:hypothetical protein n=1 Tax=Emticicia fluvialis TaxID=2974474 RepID=UPI00216585F4|nr:hypothetical protein [Emticicia fluvialis]
MLTSVLKKSNLFSMKNWTFIFLLVSHYIFGQTPDYKKFDSDKSAKDSVMYTKLKTRMEQSRIGRQFYGFLFRDVYNTNALKNEINKLDANPFEIYKGKIIEKVTIRQLDIFGPTVNDTTRRGDRFERFLSKNLHRNTREGIIRRSFLLFGEGDKLVPQYLKDTERLLRANPSIHDARILVNLSETSEEMVEVVVLVQDVWSINVDASASGINDFRFGIEDRNFLGTGHSFLNRATWRKDDPYQPLGYRSIYTIPYIGKSFVTGQMSAIYERDLSQYSIRVSRPFLTVETKNAGAVELGYYKLREYKKLGNSPTDKEMVYQTGYYYSDLWYGRAFKLKSFNNNQRLIIAARNLSYDYKTRPEVRADTNKIYWDRNTTLISIGYSTRNYKRDVLIYGFGRTEDVPTGSLHSLTVGREETEFGGRQYAALQYANGTYLSRNHGYLYFLASAGTYFKKKTTQQGILSFQSYYFSPLMRLGQVQSRNFINLGFTYGINRDPVDYLNISGQDGIIGVNSNALIGDKRLTLGLESVLFSKKSLLGFRIAYFTFANFGLVSLSDSKLFSSTLYRGYGVGLRFRNENLTIKTFQIRVGYYPNIPAISSNLRLAFDGIQPLRLRDFDISAPTIIPLR